ncbi:YARHG domain-containing protein [Ancylomarina sp. DW003]|nr:YARHG domain-containing protein [Ancylomarina sp. DW003]MDE5422754.1 YARHG domain-containing protein [Ancylomarina sp. DW003]
MRNRLLLLYLIIVPFVVSGQKMGAERIDTSKIKTWEPKFTFEYQSIYHFGDSEMESELILILGIDKDYAQIKTGSWSDDGKLWIWHWENLKSVRVEGSKFYSDKTNGEFVIYESKERIKGLKIYESWSPSMEKGEFEIGIQKGLINSNFPGKYPQASMRKLTREELSELSKSNLQIMRNEVFARYGFIFKSGEKMDLYFQNQDWYNGQYKNVNSFLTELEKDNLRLISQLEKR